MPYFVRATLRPTASPAAATMLQHTYSAHQAVWDAFTDGPDRRRDFLYRLDDENGTFLAVCARMPASSNTIWNIETKPYHPSISTGESFIFALRANATRRSRGDAEGRRHDVVFDALRKARDSGKTTTRQDVVQYAGLAWLERQGTVHGFETDPHATRVDRHRIHEFHKKRGTQPIRMSELDFTGILRVTKPREFQEVLIHGIGPGKAFGFGLLTIRRP